MGMKVAAVSVMCSDERVFQAMMDAGTPCPKDGLIGDAAKEAWEAEKLAMDVGTSNNFEVDEEGNILNEKRAQGAGAVAGVLGLLLLL